MLLRIALEERMNKPHLLGFKRKPAVRDRIDGLDATGTIRDQADRSRRRYGCHCGVAPCLEALVGALLRALLGVQASSLLFICLPVNALLRPAGKRAAVPGQLNRSTHRLA